MHQCLQITDEKNYAYSCAIFLSTGSSVYRYKIEFISSPWNIRCVPVPIFYTHVHRKTINLDIDKFKVFVFSQTSNTSRLHPYDFISERINYKFRMIVSTIFFFLSANGDLATPPSFLYGEKLNSRSSAVELKPQPSLYTIVSLELMNCFSLNFGLNFPRFR